MNSTTLGRIFQLQVIVGVLVLVGVIVGGASKSTALEHFHWYNNNQDYTPEQPIHFSHVLHAGELDMQCEYCHTSADHWRHATIPPLSTCMNCHGTEETKFAELDRMNRNLGLGVEYKLANEEVADKPFHEYSEEDRAYLVENYLPVFASKHPNVAPIGGGTFAVPKIPRTPRGSRDVKKMREHFINGTPIQWVRVHDLPDFVWFNHSAHVRKGIECQECHGDCETFEEMKQFSDLSMGWCLNCHRDKNQEKEGERFKYNAPTHCSACHN